MGHRAPAPARSRLLLSSVLRRGLLILSVGCGGGADEGLLPPPTSPDPTPPPPPPPSRPPASAVPSSAPFGPVEAGKWADAPIGVTVLDADGQPVPGAPYRWAADDNAGWVYPTEGTTRPDGRLEATWVAGSPGDGLLTLTVGSEEPPLAVQLATRSVPSESPPWGFLSLSWESPPGNPTGYAVDLTPLAEPLRTYYAAFNVAGERLPGEFFYGFYIGLQRGGSRFDRQLQFSMWDVADGTGNARVIQRGEGAFCSSFGGEGTGQKCEFNYPWHVGATYRFEVTWEPRDQGIALTAYVTDLAAGERRLLAILGAARPLGRAAATTFVEDFRRTAPTCLAQSVRSAAIRRAMVRTSDGAWRPVTNGVLSRGRDDYSNRGTPPCANTAAREHPAGLEVVMGGRTTIDPDITRVAIPE